MREQPQLETEAAAQLFDNWFDPIEAGLRDRAREFLQAMLEGASRRVAVQDVDPPLCVIGRTNSNWIAASVLTTGPQPAAEISIALRVALLGV
jgi:hypothetical protein